MNTPSITAAAALSAIALISTAGTAAAAAPTPRAYKNCTDLNKVYPHGVAKKGAKDHTSGRPVTTFFVDSKAYALNTARDRDKDGIACEKV